MMRDFWIFLFVIGLILFSWPFMSIFMDDLVLYLFSAWLLLIVLVFLAVRRKGNEGG
jgi:hypothetical protein